MRGDGRADLLAGAVDQVEDAGGVPASCMIWANSSALSGESSLGFSTTVQPEAMAGATLAVIW